MTAELFSPNVFHWIIIVLTGGVAGLWGVLDALKVVRLWNADRSDPMIRDKQFGYSCGVVIGAIGVTGCVLYHSQFVA